MVSPPAAAIAVYLHVAVFGATLVSGFWLLLGERLDPHSAKSALGPVGAGANAGAVIGGLIAWYAGRRAGAIAMLPVLAAITAVCWIAIRRVAATPALSVTDSGEPAPSGSRVLRDVPYLQGVAALVALGAFAEALLDYLLSARAVERFGPGAPLMGFFAAFHTGVSVAAAAVLAVGAAPALRHLGIAGVVALRPAAAGIGALTAWLAPGLLTAVLARGRGGRPAQLSLSHRLRAPLHPAAVRAQAPGQGDPGRRLRSRRHGGRQRRRDGGARHERRAPYGPACSHGRGRDPDRGDCGEAAPRLLRTAAVLAITEDKPEDL